MDIAQNVDLFSLWLTQYGSLSLFILLAVGIIALPVPEETLMVIAGILMHKGTLPIVSTVIAAFLGVLCGISVSYLLGKTAGLFLVKKYGSWIGLTEKRQQKVHDWFERFGKWTLLIGYFIPGVRHLTGVCAGTSGLSYKHFALYAYSGAAIWVILFLSIGYFFGKRWISPFEEMEITSELLVISIVIIAVVALLSYLYKKSRK